MYFSKYILNNMCINRIIHRRLFVEKLNKIKYFEDTKPLLNYFTPNINNINMFNYRYINGIKNKEILDVTRNNGYTKMKVFENNLLDCYFIYWDPYSCSPIHNHPNNGCYFKILNNNLIEQKYNYVHDYYDKTKMCRLKETEKKIITKNKISYIDDFVGYHRICNPNNNIVTSIHIYSPPNFKATTFKTD